MKFFSCIIVFLILTGCEQKQPVAVYRSDNPAFNAEKLFTEDGCSVYRFFDQDRSHYYVRCKRDQSEALNHISEICGKGCVMHYDENIKTEEVK